MYRSLAGIRNQSPFSGLSALRSTRQKRRNRRHRRALELLRGPAALINTKSTWTFGSPSILYMYWRETGKLSEELEHLKASLSAKEEQYLRLAAEYDNFRKRSQKEKESIYADAKAINDHRAAEAEAETIEDTSAQEA